MTPSPGRRSGPRESRPPAWAQAPCRGLLQLPCASSKAAQALAQALGPENGPWASCSVEGRAVVCLTQGEEILSLLRATDDLLACAQAALGVTRRIDDEPSEPQ